MKTDQEILDLIAAKESELKELGEEHDKDRAAFLERGSKRQFRVTHLEGRIAQLKELLPAPAESSEPETT